MIPLSQVPDGEDYPPLSALNDLLFCERRAFLHRVEGVWVENAHTLGGSLQHRRVHASGESQPMGVRMARELRIVSHTLRVQGVTDLVEFHPNDDGREVPFPVEYKRGKRRKWDNDDVQLCAQAIALEEMLGTSIPAGAIFHAKSKRRREVAFTESLREKTIATARRLHEILGLLISPPPIRHAKCKQCSLYRLCLPELLSSPAAYRRAAAELFASPVS